MPKISLPSSSWFRSTNTDREADHQEVRTILHKMIKNFKTLDEDPHWRAAIDLMLPGLLSRRLDDYLVGVLIAPPHAEPYHWYDPKKRQVIEVKLDQYLDLVIIKQDNINKLLSGLRSLSSFLDSLSTSLVQVSLCKKRSSSRQHLENLSRGFLLAMNKVEETIDHLENAHRRSELKGDVENAHRSELKGHVKEAWQILFSGLDVDKGHCFQRLQSKIISLRKDLNFYISHSPSTSTLTESSLAFIQHILNTNRWHFPDEKALPQEQQGFMRVFD